MPKKYVIQDGRLYISVEEASSILKELSEGVKALANPKDVLLKAAVLFLEIELQWLLERKKSVSRGSNNSRI